MCPPNPGSRDVLLVDDDEFQRLYFREELEGEGYRIRLAGDGREALKEIAEKRPGVVVMDVTSRGWMASKPSVTLSRATPHSP